MKQISFSIIVATFNRHAMVGEAIASARSQSVKPLEIIVVDGGSTDGTVEWVETQPDLTLLRGPDHGTYDAFNKGIAAATGDIISILNSDDLYPNTGVLKAISEALERNPAADAICGIASLTRDGTTVAVYENLSEMELRKPRTSLIGACVLNARFFRRSAAAKVGPFDFSYRFVSDRDWLTRWCQQGLTTVALPIPVYVYRQHAGSLTFDTDRHRETEIRQELLRVARTWRANTSAKPEIARMAELLEGRCRAMLAARALRGGDFSSLAKNLFSLDDHMSLAPLLSIARGGIDWISHKD